MTTTATVEPDPTLMTLHDGDQAIVENGTMRCECLLEIELEDIRRGYHSCGRLLELRCGPENFGA